MSKLALVLVTVLSSLYLSNAYKMLVIFPLPGKSHSILAEGVVNRLASAGHEVTYVTSIIPDKLQKGVTIVDVSNSVQIENKFLNIKSIMNNKIGNDFLASMNMFVDMSKKVLSNAKIQEFLTDKTQKFDVVIAEWMMIEVYAGFAGIYNCPFIWFSTVEPHWMVLQLVDEMPNPSYNSHIRSTTTPPLSFTQRVTELSIQIIGKLFQNWYVSGIENEIYETQLAPHIRARGYPVPNLELLKHNVSLVLSNSHLSMGAAVRLPPNFIPIGGYHIDDVVKPLPEDLQKLMDNAKHGIIYFSMGSVLKSQYFPTEVKQELLNIFGELKQTVLWKFEEDFPNRPDNVHILKWAPQQSILAHKNCVLFITHGGLLSTTESIHFGVPTIGIPVFGDQHINVARGVNKGYAKKVDLSYSMAKDLKVAIQEMINDSSYSKKVKELSFIYHHRPAHPGKELAHWVEHVIKTGGAPHLRSPAYTTPWYQKVYLDLAIVLLVVIIAIKHIFKYICRTIRHKRSTNSKIKQN